jgi:hypothetical protein
MDIQTAEPLVPEPSLVEVEIATVVLKSYKSPGIDQSRRIDKLFRSMWNKEELPQESITVPIHKKGDKTL